MSADPASRGTSGSLRAGSAPRTDDDLLRALRRFEGRLANPVADGPEPVNPAMIRHWCDAMGDRNPRYRPGPEQVAPPAMLQAWCMKGLEPPPAESGLAQLRAVLREAGYTGVVATNCTQTYARDLRPGDRLREERVIESVSDRKSTSLGDGFFVTTRGRYLDAAGELVAEMEFRMLYFRPAAKPAPMSESRRPRPSTNEDNAFFFEGARDGKLLIQRCDGCGALQVALIELEEGVRLVTNLVGVEPADVRIDMPVELELVPVDDELTLPMFRPVAGPEVR
jgi:hypothetical protein